MISETGMADEPACEPAEDAAGAIRCRRAKAAKRRRQTKFSRPVRLALWLGLPALLWGGIYLGWRSLS